jgi:hypothetical protein
VNVVGHHYIRQVVTITHIGTPFELTNYDLCGSRVFEKPLPGMATGCNEIYSSRLGITTFAKISAMRGSIAHLLQVASFCKYWHGVKWAGLFRIIGRRG